ncbi:MAG: hypothetical protein K6T80_02040, partial [Firmicutes bacterium]|nr:hypothetical protein [Bacillota bacterium]
MRYLRQWVVALIICPLIFILGSPAAALPPPAGGPEGNTLVFWTDGDGLKAVTLMCVRDPLSPIGVVAIPVQVRLEAGGKTRTVAEAYGALGRQGVTRCLEEYFQIPIGNYLCIDQATLDKASLLVGPVVMEGKTTTLAEVFEGTYTDGPVDPQTEIRHLAARMVEPRVIARVPQLTRVVSSEVKTNLGLK